MKNGVITSVQQLRDGLRKRGHDVVIVSVQAKGYVNADPDILLIPQIEMDFGSKQGFGLALPARRRLLAFLKEHKVGLVHTHTEFGIGLAGRWAAKNLGVPRVSTSHTMYEMYTNYSFVFELKTVWRAFYRYYMKGTHVIVAPSLKAANYNKIVVPGIPIQMVPNGIDVSNFIRSEPDAEARLELRGRYGIKPADKVMVFVGRIGAEKRCEELLAALIPVLRRHEAIKFLVVGDGPALESLMAMAGTAGLEKQIVFTGFVNWADIHRFYSISDLFVTASLSEVHSMTLIEAAICGLPTVARRDESNLDLVIQGRNGHLADTDEELALVAERLATDDAARAAFSRAAREIALRFTADNHVERMERLYTKAIECFPDRLERLGDPALLDPL